MSRAETIEKLLADVEAGLEELRAEAMAEISSAKARADKNVSRHDEARRELAGVEAEIAALAEERESLPNKAYRAGMDEDYALEDDLKARYKNLGPAIGSLEDRRGDLEEELRRLCPRTTGHTHDASLHQYAEAAAVAHRRRAELEAVEERLTAALGKAVSPVKEGHEQLLGAVRGMEEARKFDLSPVGRGGLRA